MDCRNTSWKSLFGGAAPEPGESVRLEVLIFKKGGEPLLIAPRHIPARAKALDLYPAQTVRAKLAKFLWRRMLEWKFTAGLEVDSVLLEPLDPFIKFLAQVSSRYSNQSTVQKDDQGVPRFALLAGNPHAPGRRFLVLVFAPNDMPVSVVKAGNEPLAKQLIAKEASFLAEIPAGLPGIPQVRERFEHDNRSAFALDFVDGVSPGAREAQDVEPLLFAWLKAGGKLALRDLPAWQRLTQACADRELLLRLARHLENKDIQSAVFHGDLAPWNVKISVKDRAWTVLDWERGELTGPPAWDWFHYMLQPAILVQRQPIDALTRTAEQLVDSTNFGGYAQTAGLTAIKREWLVAYLLYCRDVLRPAEGSPRLVELLNLLANKWVSQ